MAYDNRSGLFQTNVSIDVLMSTLEIDENGEFTNAEVLEEIERLCKDREGFLEAIALEAKQLDAEVVAIRQEEIALAERRRAKTQKIDTIKRLLLSELEHDDLSKMETPKVVIATRKTQRVEIKDEDAALRWCVNYGEHCIKYAKPTLDKTKIKALLKDGVDVPSAEIVEDRSVSIK